MAQTGICTIHTKKTELVGFLVTWLIFSCIPQVVYAVSFLRQGYKKFSEMPTVSGQTVVLRSGIRCWEKIANNSLIK